MRIGRFDDQLDLVARANRGFGVPFAPRDQLDFQIPLDGKRAVRHVEAHDRLLRLALWAGLSAARASVITATSRLKFGASFAAIGIASLFAPFASVTVCNREFWPLGT